MNISKLTHWLRIVNPQTSLGAHNSYRLTTASRQAI